MNVNRVHASSVLSNNYSLFKPFTPPKVHYSTPTEYSTILTPVPGSEILYGVVIRNNPSKYQGQRMLTICVVTNGVMETALTTRDKKYMVSNGVYKVFDREVMHRFTKITREIMDVSYE